MTTESAASLPPYLVDLLAAWHGNSDLTPERCDELLARLEVDASLRRQFAEEISFAGLTRAVQSGEPRWLRIEERLGLNAREADALEERIMATLTADRPDDAKRKRRLFSAPIPLWSAAAAGLLMGLFSASVVFGYVMPRAVATASRLFALVDASFEKQSGRLPSGFPVQFGVWGGDESEVVEKSSVEAKDGKRALRFVRAEREPTLPNYGAASCDVYQIVDLRSLKAEAAPGDASLELSVQFLDARPQTGEPVKFISRVSLFAGSSDAILAEWPLTQKESLASGSGSFDSKGGTPRSWHQVTTKVMLPPQADYAVVHLVLHKPKTPAGTEAIFGEQFADDVRLTLKTQPTLPVRLAQR